MTTADTDVEWRSLLISKEQGIIRSAEEWRSFAAKAARDSDHPLNGCPQAVIDEFSATITFRSGGLAHAEYGMLVDTLTFRQFERLWEAFGMSMRLFGDTHNYHCKSPGTCELRANNICTSNC